MKNWLWVIAMIGVLAPMAQAEQVQVKSRIVGAGELDPAVAVMEPGETLHMLIKPEPGFKLRQISGCDGQYQAGIFVIEQPRRSCVVSADFVSDPAAVIKNTPAQGGVAAASDAAPPAAGIAPASATSSTASSPAAASKRSGNMLRFIMIAHQLTQNVTVTAQVVSGLGTVLPAVQTLQKNSPATLSATPALGYALQSISGCGVQSSSSPLVIAKVTENCSVSVIFVQLTNALWDSFRWDQANWG